MVLPIVSTLVIVVVLWLAPADDRLRLGLATLVAVAAGLAVTSVGVYGGILVPGLLLLGGDPRLIAPLSLFLQVIVIPLGAASHYRLGNVTRSIAIPLIVGGVVGAFAGPFVAAVVPSEIIVRLVALMIIIVAVLVLVTLRLRGPTRILANDEIDPVRVGGIGVTAGLASGISGAGWGPVGVTLLMLSGVEPRQAIGSSLLGRVVMAMAAVAGALASFWLTKGAGLAGLELDPILVLLLLTGSVAAMVPGAFIVSRLGRDRTRIVVAVASAALAVPTLILG